MTIQAKREARKAAATKVAQLVKNFPKEKTWGTEEQTQYDNLLKEVDDLDAEITRHEKILDLDAVTHIKNIAAKDGISVDEAIRNEKQVKDAFTAWARGGVSALNEDQTTALRNRMQSPMNAMSTGTGSEGGFVTEATTARQLSESMKAFGGMRQLSTVIQTESGNQIDFPTADATSEEGEIVGENGSAGSGDTSFGTVAHNVFKYSSKSIAVPFELLQDSVIDIEGYVNGLCSTRIGRVTEKHFTVGTGTGQPLGIMTSAGEGKVGASGQTDILTYDDLIDLEHSVDPAYRASGKCSWMFHDTSLREIKKLKDGQGRPLWLPGLVTGDAATILGYTYAINQSMAEMGANAKSIAFGDFSKYLIRDVMNMMMFRMTDSKYTEKGQVGFLAFFRSGGRLIDDGGAVKYYQNAAS